MGLQSTWHSALQQAEQSEGGPLIVRGMSVSSLLVKQTNGSNELVAGKKVGLVLRIFRFHSMFTEFCRIILKKLEISQGVYQITRGREYQGEK